MFPWGGAQVLTLLPSTRIAKQCQKGPTAPLGRIVMTHRRPKLAGLASAVPHDRAERLSLSTSDTLAQVILCLGLSAVLRDV